jgi:SanA protein
VAIGPSRRARLGRVVRSLFWTSVVLAIVIGTTALVADRLVARRAAPFTTASLDRLPSLDVALVLGTAPRVWQGRPNQFFERRMDAAAELYRAGKVRWLLVSGDNRSHDYDEPTAMRAALIRRGIPAEAIYRDYAGIRTLDSVLRAATVFGQPRLVVVSQRFHTERAIFLARRHGIEAWGYEADDIVGALGMVPRLREYAGRLRAVWDVLMDSEPRHGGSPVRIGVDPPT